MARFQIALSSAAAFLFLAAGFLWLRQPPTASAQVPAPFVTPADVTGDGSQHSIVLPGGTRWFEIITASGNAGLVRMGDSNTACGAFGTGRGLPFSPGGTQMLPPSLTMAPAVYYCAASGDKFAYAYGN